LKNQYNDKVNRIDIFRLVRLLNNENIKLINNEFSISSLLFIRLMRIKKIK